MSLIRAVDRVLYRAFTRDWPDGSVDQFVERLAVDENETMAPNAIGREFQVIDNKAGGLLTHTSMMIAALGVSAPVVANKYFEQGVIVIEIMAYLLVALGCLRCLSTFQHAVGNRRYDAARDELILRYELFRWCNQAAITLTLVVFISLPLLYLYVPEKTVGL
jgi:uncharacterized membrane protein